MDMHVTPEFELDHGTYSNLANVLCGHLKTLGLERRAKTVRSLREVMQGSAV